jgi:predicted phage terminase large subunit-like protein
VRPQLRALLFGHLQPFLGKAFHVLHPSRELANLPYVQFTCTFLEEIERSNTLRAIANMPPRSLKTVLCTKVFVAWLLARTPTLEIMIITGNEPLAKEIAYSIRQIMRSDFYRQITSTRIADDRSSLFDFATTEGGGVFTRTIGASIVGRGADVIILDDVNDPKDAASPDRFEFVTEQFEGTILGRLNDPQKGRVLIVAHRTSELDLTGHLLRQQSGYEHLCLPLVAPRRQTYRIGAVTWTREKGAMLRPDSHTEKDIAQKRVSLHNPDFETLYQQNPEGELSKTIELKHFKSFEFSELPNTAPVMSVDAGLVEGRHSSYSVIQIWKRLGEAHFLVDQWREQVEFDDLFQMCRRLRRRHRCAQLIIERTALGAALISAGEKRKWKGIVPIVPDGRSKSARLRPHTDIIRAGAIRLPREAEWRRDFVEEFVTFPHSNFSDQVDATTQYLEWVKGRPDPQRLEPRAVIAYALNSSTKPWRPW